MPPPTNNDDELELYRYVMYHRHTCLRLVRFYPRAPFEVDGITYVMPSGSAVIRPLLELMSEKDS